MKRINIRKTALSLLVLGCTLVPFANADTYTVNQDSIVYYQSDSDSLILGQVKEGTIVNDVTTGDNGYTLINQDNNYGYILNDNLTLVDYNQSDVKTYRRADILRATNSVNLRKGPSTDYDKIMTILENTEVECIGVCENGWYLIRVNGHIGYSSPDYFQSFNDYSMNTYRMDYGSLGFICNGYTTDRVNLRSGPSTDTQSLGLIDKDSFVQILQDHGDFYLVLTNDYQYGYISKDYLHLLKDEIYVVTDISSQITTLYKGNTILAQAYCVTGKQSTPTTLGVFTIKSKETDRYLNGTNSDGSTYHSHVNYCMKYHGGEYLHDLKECRRWGVPASHGCIRQQSSKDMYTPGYILNKDGEVYKISMIETLYLNTEIGTKVINKK